MVVGQSEGGGRQKRLEAYCQKALEMGIDGAKVINPRSIVTAEWVRVKCRFGCPRFGMSLCCPPYTPTPEITRKIIDSYEKAIMLHFHQKKEREEGKRTRDFKQAVVHLEIEIFLDGYYKAWSISAGFCLLCKECEPKGFCKHGYEARPSMEACGIDVFKTARDNGFHIEVVRTHEEQRNIFGVILIE